MCEVLNGQQLVVPNSQEEALVRLRRHGVNLVLSVSIIEPEWLCSIGQIWAWSKVAEAMQF